MWAPSEPIPRINTASGARGWRNRHGRYRLVGTVCGACEAVHFPARRICPSCRSADLAEKPLSRTGKVVCAAEDHSPLVGHGGRPVRPFAIIELDNGPSVLAELVDVRTVTPGQRVELVIRKWRRESNGLYEYGYKFRELP
ncbi:Zn-ribbon domain-containing OB-fold protein [Prauserella flavalba]|uniref:DUF35 domain-containing protein n=1 Tax=Prauserella flavalba TaxID=1477506 RepID=A0A318LVK7_9PSEU|nr:zinc ribbon domain-containing protein [Prauserella flavalba]PXY36487.1 hypothetical protein BA062_13930 [Prauserella flavalba]